MLSFLINVIEQGLLYALLTMGVMIAYQILGISDLSVDGTFPLGAVVTAVLIKMQFPASLALLLAALAGTLAGLVTGILHVKLKINQLLSGILVMTGLYSINLMLAGGRSNLPLLHDTTIFDWPLLANFAPYRNLFILLLICLMAKFGLDWFLTTRLGYLFRLVGDNESLIASLGHNPNLIKILGLGLANGLVALSGGLAISLSRYYDISIGSGMIILGLSSGILGTILLKKIKSRLSSAVIIGSISYRLIVALALRLGMDPQYLKLVTVLLFIVMVIINAPKSKKQPQSEVRYAKF